MVVSCWLPNIHDGPVHGIFGDVVLRAATCILVVSSWGQVLEKRRKLLIK